MGEERETTWDKKGLGKLGRRANEKGKGTGVREGRQIEKKGETETIYP